jgi:hypothetical protein
VKEKVSRVQRGHHPSYVMVLLGCPIKGWHLFIFAMEMWKLVPKCIKRMCYKELWNLLTQLSSEVRNWSSSRTQLLPKRPRWLRSGCRGIFWHLSKPRIGPLGVQTPIPWTINCGLFWRMRLAKSITTTWTVWRDPSWKQWQRSPRRRCVPWLQSGWRVLKACVKAEGGHFEWHYYK